MKSKTYIYITASIIVNIFISTIGVSQISNDLQYKFTQTDSSYSFAGSFLINANTDCLLDICFQIEHIQALAPDAEEIVLVREGPEWNEIRYRYKKFIYFENKSLWSRKLDREKKRVDFTLISSENNKAIMPKMVSSTGYYQITTSEYGVVLTYYQQCILAKSALTNIYLNKIEKEAVQFLHRFSEYANVICSKSN